MGQSGVKELFLLPQSSFTLSGCEFDANDKIINFNLGSTKWYQMQQIDETSEFNEKDIRDFKTGSLYWDQTQTMVFHSHSSILRKQLLQILAKPHVAIVRDNQNKYFLMGATRGVWSDAEIKIEKSFGGLNGNIITLKGTEPTAAYEVIASAITYTNIYVTSGGSGNESTPSEPSHD